MPLPEQQARALQRWCLAQAATWLPLLALLAWYIGTESYLTLEPSGGWVCGFATSSYPAHVSSTWMWVTLSLLAFSFASLWSTLKCGRHLADWVTLARFLGLSCFCFLALDSGYVGWSTWFVALFVVLADLLDGYVARHYGGSEAGAVLDMETDQFTTLVLAGAAFALTGAGVWALALPGIKYVFVLAMTALGLKSTDPKPQAGDNRRGRLICALVLSLLLGSLFPAFPQVVRMLASGLAVLLLCYSFSSDAAFLWRHARRTSASR